MTGEYSEFGPVIIVSDEGRMSSRRIVQFYEGKGVDSAGRTLGEVLAFRDEAIEYHHDFIQWLFPLRERSPVNPDAPVLTEDVIDEFLRRPELRERLQESFERMLAFYGFRLEAGPPPVVRRAKNFSERCQNWLYPGDHNHLRITRILKCLTFLGLRTYAEAFYAALRELYEKEGRDRITQLSFDFWTRSL